MEQKTAAKTAGYVESFEVQFVGTVVAPTSGSPIEIVALELGPTN